MRKFKIGDRVKINNQDYFSRVCGEAVGAPINRATVVSVRDNVFGMDYLIRFDNPSKLKRTVQVYSDEIWEPGMWNVNESDISYEISRLFQEDK